MHCINNMYKYINIIFGPVCHAEQSLTQTSSLLPLSKHKQCAKVNVDNSFLNSSKWAVYTSCLSCAFLGTIFSLVRVKFYAFYYVPVKELLLLFSLLLL